jgi:serine/threonine protein kinase
MDRSTFLRDLRRAKLPSAPAIEEAFARLPESDGARAVARGLVAGGLLSRFQARQLLAGKAGKLTLGPYCLVEPLGRGGAGRVYKAVHTATARAFALKVILPRVLKESGDLSPFLREVRAAAQLEHPNIVTAYDAAQAKGVYYLVMEYVAGPSLHDLVKEQGPLPVSLACELIRQAAEALQHAHEKGVVHRDIKPANLLIVPPATSPAGGWADDPARPPTPAQAPLLKVVDFGLARLRQGAGSGGVETISGGTGTVLGTPDYISPEQAHSIHDTDIRSDLYSLGCTLYYALTGRVPFPGSTPMAKLVKHLMEEPPPLETLRPDAPAGVAAIYRRLLAKDRDQRFQTPAELAHELARWCGVEGGDIAPAVPDPESSQEAPDRSQEVGTSQPVPGQIDTATSTGEGPCLCPDVPAPIDAAFRAKWKRWTGIVERSVRRRGSSSSINAQEFEQLQQELVRGCQEHARVARGGQREFFESLAELVKPWLTPKALTNADEELQGSLLELCQQALRQLDRWPVARPTRRGGDTILSQLLARLKRGWERLFGARP